MSQLSALIAIVASGGMASHQQAYINPSSSAGSGRDLAYYDVTISAVSDVSKCVCWFEGGFGGGLSNGSTYSSMSSKPSCRLLSPTTLRISGAAGGSYLIGTWHVVELN